MDVYQTAVLSSVVWDWIVDLILGKKSDGTTNGN